MNKVEVLVVEDEFIVAEDIRRNLVKLGYLVNKVVKTGNEAIKTIRMQPPDIVLMDINLGSGMSGIEAAEKIREIVSIPIIYVTAHSDTSTFERAKKTQPDAFIVKPFNFSNLHLAIELAIFNYSKKQHPEDQESINDSKEVKDKPGSYLFNGSIFLKNKKGFDKVNYADVIYIKADGSYSQIFTDERSYILTLNLQAVFERLAGSEFFRVHRSYVVNVNCIESIEESGVKIRDTIIPVSKKLRKDLLKKINPL